MLFCTEVGLQYVDTDVCLLFILCLKSGRDYN